jgi:hypothetical protein
MLNYNPLKYYFLSRKALELGQISLKNTDRKFHKESKVWALTPFRLPYILIPFM